MSGSRLGLLGLLAGVLVGARARRRNDPTAADHLDLLLVERDARRSAQHLRGEVVRIEREARRRTALTVALVAVAALPGLALAIRPDTAAAVGAVAVGAYALLAVGSLATATWFDRADRSGR